MAAIRWTFPDGAHSDVLTAPLAGADSSNFSGGTAMLSSDYVLAGMNMLSAKFNLTVNGHLWYAKEGLSATSYAYDLYMYQTIRTGGRVYIAWAGSSSSARSIGIFAGGLQNEISLNDSTGTVWSSSTEAFPDNTWIRFSVYCTCGAGTGTARLVWYHGHDTTPMGDTGLLTNLSTQTSIDRIRIGGKASISGITSGELYFASWAYDSAATGLIAPFSADSQWNRRNGGVWTPLTANERDAGAWSVRTTNVK